MRGAAGPRGYDVDVPPTPEELVGAALACAARGWLVFPCHSIRPGGGCTCRDGAACKRAGKHPLTPNGLKDATRDEAAIREWWARWPWANPAMRTGGESGVWVLDVEAGLEGAATMEALLGAEPEPDTVAVRTGSGGLHLYYRWPGDAPVRSRVRFAPGADVRGAGGYVLLPPSLHASGGVYDWTGGWPAIAAAGPGVLEAVRGPQATRGTPTSEAEAEYGVPDDLAREVRSALASLPSDDRDLWLRVGMALKRGGSEHCGHEDALFPMWTEWSRTSEEKYDLPDCRRVWASITPPEGGPEVRLATLFHAAQARGWTGAGIGRPEAVPAEAAAEPQVLPPRQGEPIPPHLLDPPGLLGDVCRWINRTTIRPQPVAALGAALGALAALYGQRYCLPSNLRTNLYLVVLGPTGCGKDGPRARAESLLDLGGEGDILGGEDFASGQAVLGALQRSSRRLFLVDEFGEMLSAVTRRGAPEYLKKIVSVLLRLYGRAGGVLRATEYASEENRAPDIREPHAVLLGMSTPEQFFSAFSSGGLQGGLLNRLTVLQTFDPRPPRQVVRATDPPRELVEELRRHSEAGAPRAGVGNIAQATGVGAARVVEYTPRAWESLRAFEDDLDDRIRKGTLPPGSVPELWQRAVEQGEKLALIRAVGRDPAHPDVGADDVHWGLELACWSIRTMESQVAWNLADSPFEANVKKTLRFIEGSGRRATRSAIVRATRMPKRQLDEILAHLEETGEIQSVQETTGGRPRTTYTIHTQGA